MKRLKADAEKFTSHIDSLQKSEWIGSTRQWWPKYVFHFTNINNAVKILESGKLLCRNTLDITKEMETDNASPEIIENTSTYWKNFVRLYFRPRTPTQYQNEGYRFASERGYQAHCPVPIFFLFNSKKILIQDGVLFSNGNLASPNVEVHCDAENFRRLPFNLIYHSSFLTDDNRSQIIFHRHAEVIVPDELDLQYLSHIWCRSEAEYKTFMQLLSSSAMKQWGNIIGGGKKGNLFYRQWFFVEKVNMTRETVSFTFNVGSRIEPFNIKFSALEVSTGHNHTWEKESFKLEGNCLTISLFSMSDPSHYIARLFFDDQIMFCDEFKDNESALL